MPDGNSPEIRNTESAEILFNPKSIAIVTGTLYPTWYRGAPKKPLTTDKVRGDIALQSAKSAREQDFNFIAIDGGSSEAFVNALRETDIVIDFQKEKGGQGPARREGLEKAEGLGGVKVICLTEPEKEPIIPDCVRIASLPILRGEADIVMPKRDPASFLTYPKIQAEQEQRSNDLYNRLLRSRGLLKASDPDLDFWFGVRILANRPEITEIFKKVYQFDKNEGMLHKKINVEMYSNVLFFPIVEALYRSLRVASVPVSYTHPFIQTGFEEGKWEFDSKRLVQRRTIVTELIHFIRRLESSPKSRLSIKQ